MLYSKSSGNFVFAIAVSFFLFFAPPSRSYSQNEPTDEVAVFILKGNTRLQQSGKAAEGVDLELKKNGNTITKITSGKNGKYFIQMNVSTTDKNNEYLLYISQVGTVPKTLTINTYISQEEFNANPFPRYEYSLEIKIIETTEKDIIVKKPSGRIHWDNEQKGFAFDQTFAEIAQKEDPDKLAKEAAEKKKKEKEEEARLKAKADSIARTDSISKVEAQKLIDKNLELVRRELRQKRMQDSLDSLAVAASKKNAVVEIIKIDKPISPDDVDQNAFDGTGTYSINIAKKSLKASLEKINREKAANLSAKYETNNTLTSLLNMVDEYDKKMKRQ